MAKQENDEKQSVIIIKRIKKGGGGHHGGSWKVAYADFVTAMMAFFLLLWLLSVTTDEQKAKISSYFEPSDPRISQKTSGSGGVMGGTTISPDGAMTHDNTPVAPPSESNEALGKSDNEAADKTVPDEQTLAAELEKMDKKSFQETQDMLKKAIESVPDLKELAQNLLMDMTPEGLRIQIIDQEGKPMFEIGSAKPLPQMERLLALITQAVKNLPNKISIRGHTDSKPYGKDAAYTNWELSADRSNTSRRLMLTDGLDLARIENVQGKADREPLVQNDPESARNRRISIILLKQSLVAGMHKSPEKKSPAPAAAAPAEQGPKKKETGVIYFP